MAVVSAPTVIPIDLEADCDHAWCNQHASKLHTQLDTPHYTRHVSVMRVPVSRDAWETEHRTARKRAWRAERLGYRIDAVDYSEHPEDLFEINTSLAVRQGRPMTDGYKVRSARNPLSADQTRCPRHNTRTYGILQGRRLRAYLTLHRAGELAMVSMILGHGDHLDAGIMYLLFRGVVEDQAAEGGWFYYNRHDSGQDGLRFYKERVGFAPADLEWRIG